MLHKSLLTVAAVLLDFAAAAPAVDLQTHTPQFHWRTGPHGQKWLYDGKMPVGKLFAGYSGTKPMSGIGRPISLQ